MGCRGHKPNRVAVLENRVGLWVQDIFVAVPDGNHHSVVHMTEVALTETRAKVSVAFRHLHPIDVDIALRAFLDEHVVLHLNQTLQLAELLLRPDKRDFIGGKEDQVLGRQVDDLVGTVDTHHTDIIGLAEIAVADALTGIVALGT